MRHANCQGSSLRRTRSNDVARHSPIRVAARLSGTPTRRAHWSSSARCAAATAERPTSPKPVSIRGPPCTGRPGRFPRGAAADPNTSLHRTGGRLLRSDLLTTLGEWVIQQTHPVGVRNSVVRPSPQLPGGCVWAVRQLGATRQLSGVVAPGGPAPSTWHAARQPRVARSPDGDPNPPGGLVEAQRQVRCSDGRTTDLPEARVVRTSHGPPRSVPSGCGAAEHVAAPTGAARRADLTTWGWVIRDPPGR